VEGEEIPTLQQILDGMPPSNNQPIRVDRVPGAGWRYSGGGYQIAQQLLEDVAGKPFNEIMQETILEPIGMTSSTYEIPLPTRWSENAATAHTKSGAPAYGKWRTYPERGAGGMWTTPTDVARFAIEIMRAYTSQEGTILSNEMVNEMLTAQNWNGYGLGVYTFLGGRIFFHPGDNPPGYKTFMIALPKQGRGVVVMTNSAIGDQLITEIVLSVFTAYGILPPTPYIVVLGFFMMLVLVMLVVIPIAYLIHRLRMRKMDSAKQPLGVKKLARFSRTFAVLLVGAIGVLAVPYYLFLDNALQQMTVLPEADRGKPSALSLIEEGRYFARLGEIEQAMSAFAKAQNLDPELVISSSSWNELCWRSSVWGYAAHVMEACQRAAELDPDNPSIFDSRGLAKALTGDYAGAIVDFDVFVEWTKKHGWYDAYGKQREEWIAKLAVGENPFDESTLNELRNQ
jgi:tetratricopeptide (TPR) repeat protein